MSEIKDLMKDWTFEMDEQLIQYIEEYCSGWQSLEWNNLKPSTLELLHYPKLSNVSLKSIQFRFIILKLFNRKLSRIISLLNLENRDYNENNLSSVISQLKEKIFKSIKMDVYQHTLSKSLVEMNPIQIKVNRTKAAEDTKHKHINSLNSLFSQVFIQLQAFHPKVLSRKNGAYKITFIGESAEDFGGPFRESLTQMCSEIQSEQLDILSPIPNYKRDVGQNKEKFMPNPHANTQLHLEWFRFIGIMMGIGLLSSNIIELDFPSIVWKKIVNKEVTVEDLEMIDHEIYNSMASLREIDKKGINEENFNDYIFDQFITKSSEGLDVELIKDGKKKKVTYHNRIEYADMVENYRLNEINHQVDAIKEGLFSIIQPRFFSIFTWNEIENLICGTPDIDINILKKHTIYEGYNISSREIKDFWAILTSFTKKEKSNYIRFVWGRSRLPVSEEKFTSPMKIQKYVKSKRPDDYLPLSHTCFFSIELPPYSSKSIMREKLLYAITHCYAIDTDITTHANEARNLY
jgi:hypothetical protein